MRYQTARGDLIDILKALVNHNAVPNIESNDGILSTPQDTTIYSCTGLGGAHYPSIGSTSNAEASNRGGGGAEFDG